MEKKLFRKNLFIPFLKIIIDIIALESAFSAAYFLRFQSPLQNIFPVTKGYPPFENYLLTSIFLTLVYIILFALSRSYKSRYFNSYTQDIPIVIRVCVLGILVAMSGAFLYRDFSYSRLTFLIMFMNTLVYMLLLRYAFHLIKRKILIPRGFSVQNLILVGSGNFIPNFFSQLRKEKNIPFQILGYCSDGEVQSHELKNLGPLKQLPKIVDRYSPDALLLSFEENAHDAVVQIIRLIEGKNVEIFFIPDFLYLIGSQTKSIEIAGMPLIRLKAMAFSGWQGFLKRTFDLFTSGLALLLLSPIFLFIGFVIKLGSKGSVFYRQSRVGMDNREFLMLKFRSMVENAENETGPVWAKSNDPRVTVIGKFLRRSSIDELPQLINVFKGEMSLVGPRPERKVFVEEFQQYIPKYAERHRVRSGMTGWAQVNGLRGQSPIEDRTRYDVYYIENWSLWFDIKIILMTFMTIVRGENAY
jgi:exopolysaccharide biosynthesis polyprenyl glycosylphosphotransferase